MMTDCPFHDLPPGQVINVDWDGHVIPRSAGLLCDDWHIAEVLRPALEAMKAAAMAELHRTIDTK